MIPEIHIEDYNYNLPDERIAKYPLPERDSSKLLIYKNGEVQESRFKEITAYLPDNSIMVFNDTKVVPARMFFHKSTGATIEIFCLEPVKPAEYAEAFACIGRCRWKCIIGNSKRWKNEVLFYDTRHCKGSTLDSLELKASLVERDGQTGVVDFCWEGGHPFSYVLELCGQMPIPPYLNRETESIDLERYQTLYAHIRGSVAAPTAGLHFTDAVLNSIREMGIDMETVCLHVGAGTFLPVKSSLVSEHPMHREPLMVSKTFINNLLVSRKSVTAVGTTSVRTLESLYYAGVSILETGEPREVEQWAPYTRDYKWSTEESLQAIADYLDKKGMDELHLGTRIIIVPGFKFRIVDAMVTNFHQPQSTLLLLITAFVGGDWKTIYNYAFSHGFRFLSYGDSSLLFRRDK